MIKCVQCKICCPSKRKQSLIGPETDTIYSFRGDAHVNIFMCGTISQTSSQTCFYFSNNKGSEVRKICWGSIYHWTWNTKAILENQKQWILRSLSDKIPFVLNLENAYTIPKFDLSISPIDSWAAETPHKYVRGWKYLTNNFPKSKFPVTMMTSSNGYIFRVVGLWCGEFTGHLWILRTKASDAELWCFF